MIKVNNKLSDFPNQIKNTINEYAILFKIGDINKQYIYCGSDFDKITKKDDLKNHPNVTSFFSLFFDEIMYKMLISKLFLSCGKNSNDIITTMKRKKKNFFDNRNIFYHESILGKKREDALKEKDFIIDFNDEKLNKVIDGFHLLNLNKCFQYFKSKDIYNDVLKWDFEAEITGFNLEIKKTETDKAK